jgi:hypothetical protein
MTATGLATMDNDPGQLVFGRGRLIFANFIDINHFTFDFRQSGN